MNVSKKTKKAGALISTMIIIMITVFAFLSTSIMKPIIAEPDYPDEHLFIDATYLLKTDETNDSVSIICNLYLTNTWLKKSGEINATAFVIESDRNFAIYKNKVEIGVLNADATTELEIPIELGNNSYKIDILLFEDGKLTIKGELTISAHPVYKWDEVVHSDGRVEQKQVVEYWDMDNSYSKFTSVRP